MTRSTSFLSDHPHGIAGLLRRLIAGMDRIPQDAIALAARVFAAAIFWQSGQTKLEGWRVSDSAIELFREEYRLPLLDPVLAAHLATLGEHLFPLLLVFGLASRFAALALLGMTAVIQIFVYPDAWPTHGIWAVALLVVVARGPGRLSADHLLARRMPALRPLTRE
ncbi:DoxX family protein [Ferrovibrio terrae]|uniref:DoxX family protein n=2 Tax=Ferrovibrio terrae TaxID=2594003 RepID=A0A516H7A1_9PROT|nr:DoxX family protein [Ferrovibrio terrae]